MQDKGGWADATHEECRVQQHQMKLKPIVMMLMMMILINQSEANLPMLTFQGW